MSWDYFVIGICCYLLGVLAAYEPSAPAEKKSEKSKKYSRKVLTLPKKYDII